MPINNITIQGRLGKDAETAGGAKGSLFTTFSIAFPERVYSAKGEWEDGTGWINAVVYGERGEKLAKWLKKGTPVAVSGKLHQSKWTDKKDGTTRTSFKIIVDEVFFGSKKAKDEDGGLADEDYEI